MSCGSAPAWLPFGGVQGGCAIETGAAEVRSSMVMDELHARVSKGGRVLCGRLDADGHYTCDEPLAGFAVPDATRPHVRYLIALDGWALDRKKAIWHRTTSVEDRAAAGIVPPRAVREAKHYPTLPALARCPKCRTVQWLDPVRLGVAPGPNY